MKQNDNSLKILIVDDDEGIRMGYSQLFKMYGYGVTVASNGFLGIQTFESSSFDLVITDILMPGKDGLTMIKQIRDLDLNVKIIAISGGGASHNMGILDIAKTFGADMILEKPISTVDLINIVNDIFRE